jgi:hypothetical protein
LAADDASSVANAIDLYFNGAEFAEAFGLKPDPGTPDPRNLLCLAHRDDLIRDAVAEFLRHITSVDGKVGELHILLRRYRATAWERGDRECTQMPAGYAHTLRGALWEIFAAFPSKQALSTRQLRRILTSARPFDGRP